MSLGDAVIDIAADPFGARAGRRRAMLRIGVPILGVVLIIAAILGISLYASGANQSGALHLADDVLAATDARIAEQVTAYFAVPTRALAEAETLAEHEPAGEARRTLIEKFAMGAMKHVPQIADFIVGDPDGNFMMFRRAEGGGIDTKLITTTPGPRQVVWIRRSAAGEEIGREEDPADTYDPRTRPWYSGALASNGIFWTDVYVFYTGKEPGITGSTPYLSPEGRHFVVGVDIRLADLSKFLADLKIGESGRAMIIGGDGRIIAYPVAQRLVKDSSSGPITARVDEIGDDVAAGAYDHFRIDGPGRQTLTVEGRRYLAALTPLQKIGRDWSIMSVVPEKDFIGFVERSNRIALVMSLAIVALAVIGAALLVLQGLRGDRFADLARNHSHAMARQTEALERVAHETDLFDPAHPEQFPELTEVAAEITGARRADLWYLQGYQNVMRCADSLDSESSSHTGGFELHHDEAPRFFDEVAAGNMLAINDAAHDPRTAEVFRLTMAPVGTRSLSTIPVRRRGRAVGFIALHDVAEIAGVRHFLHVLANMAALHAPEDTEEPRRVEAGPVNVIEPDTVHSRSGDLTLRGLDAAILGEALYPDVAVFVLRIDDPATKANGSAAPPKLFDEITCGVQEIAADEEIPYLKQHGCDIIGAAGFSPGDPAAASRITNAAITVRDRLTELFKANGLDLDFRLGIDCGVAIGQSLGRNPPVFNLWGTAVQTAQIMASSALPGSIQASEAVYRRLRQGFLFRQRGTFYLPAVGTSQTFFLAGRL